MSLTKVLVLYILGLSLVLIPIQARHPSSKEAAQQDMAHFMELQRQGTTKDNPILGNANTIIRYQSYGFTGFRGIFQWMAGEIKKTEGIFNFLQFFTDQAGGYIGLQTYDKSSKYTVIFSVWDALGGTAGENFKCSTFGGEGIGYKCFNNDFQLKSNGIYYLDVEISGTSLRGFISEPQVDLSGVESMDVQRQLIGEITYPAEQTNLIPYAYYNENWLDQPYCKWAYELVTVNHAPRQYNDNGSIETLFKEASLYNSVCDWQNILVAMTEDQKTSIYLTRPSVGV